MQRKLLKCKVCGEWFNTTYEIMAKHYQEKHEFYFNKQAKVAELIAKAALFELQARNAPFPLSLTYSLAAVQTRAQLQQVITCTNIVGK